MDDVIYRQAAIDEIAHATFDVTISGRRGFIDYKKEFEKAFVAIRDKYIEALEALPSADQNRWIPCSERLPEKHQVVLTTIKGVDLFRECADKNFFEALATAKKRTLVSVGYLGDDGWYGADGFPQIIPTVAWMPLPEPWRGEEEDGNQTK